MKTMLLFLSLTWIALAQPYRAGVVQDRDGQTNLRDRPDLRSQVISTVATGQTVLILSQQGAFYDVLKLQPIKGRPDSFGYLHTSRVTPTVTGALGAGCIQDKDGWSNLRSAPSGTASVLGKIRQHEWFVILDKGTFYKVMTHDGRVGYLHSSRVEWIIPNH